MKNAKALASDFSKKAEECSALEKAVNALFADVEALREQTKQKEAEVAEARDAIDLREKALIKRESSASDKGAQKDADAEAKDEANDEDKA